MPSCPFNSKAYLSSLAHLGSVEIRAGAPFPVLKRPIEGTECRDGLGAWPYVLVEHDEQLEALTEAFSDLVTLTLVTQPGFRPLGQKSNAIRFKEHYVFDPARPYPTLGRRTREHLRRAAKSFDFDTTTTRAEALKIIPLYAELKRRRGLAGGFFDFPNAHFEAVASLNAAIFFRVNGPRGAAAMACGIVFGDWIQLLHIAIADEGLRGDAGYLLMQGMLDFAREDGRRLGMGGIPRHGDAGMVRFKARWSNLTEPVYLSRFVNDVALYAALARGRETQAYFPAYRAPSTMSPHSMEGATSAALDDRGTDDSRGPQDRRGARAVRQLVAHNAGR